MNEMKSEIETVKLSPETATLSWELLVRLEPRLLALESLLKAVQPDDDLGHWYRAGKPLLTKLVGWSRNDAPLAEDPNHGDSWSGAELLAAADVERGLAFKPEPGSWESRLSSSEAYDVAYRHLVSLG